MAVSDPALARARAHIPLLRAWVLSDERPLPVEMFETDGHLSLAEARRGPWRKAAPDTRWGAPWSSAWFRLRPVVPTAWKGRTVALRFRSGEALAFRNGTPWQGLDEHHQFLLLADPARGGERETVLIEAGASGPFGRFSGPLAIEHADLAIYNRDFEHLLFEMEALLDVAGERPLNDPLRRQVLRALNRALEAIDRILRFPKGRGIEPWFAAAEAVYGVTPDAPALPGLATPEEIAAAVKAAKAELAAVQQPARVPYLPTLWAVGHGHIDLAWLWPLEETIRKCGRTWATQLQLCREFPDYVFAASQGCEYAYCKDRYPAVFEGIVEAVKAGQWDPLISMWVESDCMITGGESLIRQFLWGIRWSLKEFGSVREVVWLPDAFGYCAQMPQIMRRCGMRYFCTTKLWWNDTNDPPMTSFWWQGIDGSRVLTHFPNNYNNSVRGGDLLKYLDYNREADRVRDLLFIYGYGDGGGGPSRKQAHLITSGLRNQQGVPPVKPGRVLDFFRRLQRVGDDLPTWVGEHYNEFHRGCYTTQARTKRGNRLGEAALREAELWAVAARAALGRAVPQRQLDAAWERLLHNQFHDILPGSSIGKVYEETHRDHETVLAAAADVREAALAALAAKADTSGDGRPVLVFNALSWPRSGVVALPVSARGAVHAVDADGAVVPQQVVRRGRQREVLVWADAVPACGYAVFRLVPGRTPASTGALTVGARRVETPFYSIRLDRAGRFTRLFDKRAGREVLPEGRPANNLLLFSDLPTEMGLDAWEIDPHYRSVCRDLDEAADVQVVETGPVRGTLRVRRQFGESTVEQDIHFYAHSPRIDFVTRVDWHESHKLLKVAFPVDVDNPRATYEVQFGHLERPVHANTSWEAARFEVPAQKWADLAEPGYGISLLNDCKHGYDVFDGALGLSLLRSPQKPDSGADIGEHRFTYSLWPHAGDFREAGTIPAAYDLNTPLRAVAAGGHRGSLPGRHGFLTVEPANVVVEAVKPAEDGDGLVVRLYEAHGGRADATVTFGFDVAAVEEVDLVERPVATMKVADRTVAFPIRPFEIRSLHVKPGK